ncbi:MAG: peptidoglycan editing factor PgeF [Anaerolineales bacterium]|nr:peptidoglycan editing factor PgeF [Anaerolineales bacterium]
MPFFQPDSIRYFAFDIMADSGVLNAVITRRGGLSPQPWDTLNMGATVGDDPQRVIENRRRAFQALSRPFESLYDVWQVHGCQVVRAQSPRPPGEPHLKADAILTDRPGVTLFMRFADCVPIFLYDPSRRVVGLVHAGWQGTVNKVAAHAIRAMQSWYGSQPGDILAGIGPSIGPHHYPVGREVVFQVRSSFGQQASEVLRHHNDGNGDSGVQFDLRNANRLVLEEQGVRQIEIAGICTACFLEDWFSHRAENGRTGRFGALIAL